MDTKAILLHGPLSAWGALFVLAHFVATIEGFVGSLHRVRVPSVDVRVPVRAWYCDVLLLPITIPSLARRQRFHPNWSAAEEDWPSLAECQLCWPVRMRTIGCLEILPASGQHEGRRSHQTASGVTVRIARNVARRELSVVPLRTSETNRKLDKDRLCQARYHHGGHAIPGSVAYRLLKNHPYW